MNAWLGYSLSESCDGIRQRRSRRADYPAPRRGPTCLLSSHSSLRSLLVHHSGVRPPTTDSFSVFFPSLPCSQKVSIVGHRCNEAWGTESPMSEIDYHYETIGRILSHLVSNGLRRIDIEAPDALLIMDDPQGSDCGTGSRRLSPSP